MLGLWINGVATIEFPWTPSPHPPAPTRMTELPPLAILALVWHVGYTW